MKQAFTALAAFAIASGLVLPQTVDAQSTQVLIPCHDAAEIHEQLSSKYEEAPIAYGKQSNGNLLQIYNSKEKDTWTVISTTPQGKSCIVAAGKYLKLLPQEPEGQPANALPAQEAPSYKPV